MLSTEFHFFWSHFMITLFHSWMLLSYGTKDIRLMASLLSRVFSFRCSHWLNILHTLVMRDVCSWKHWWSSSTSMVASGSGWHNPVGFCVKLEENNNSEKDFDDGCCNQTLFVCFWQWYLVVVDGQKMQPYTLHLGLGFDSERVDWAALGRGRVIVY